MVNYEILLANTKTMRAEDHNHGSSSSHVEAPGLATIDLEIAIVTYERITDI